jgi:hypothetical protein
VCVSDTLLLLLLLLECLVLMRILTPASLHSCTSRLLTFFLQNGLPTLFQTPQVQQGGVCDHPRSRQVALPGVSRRLRGADAARKGARLLESLKFLVNKNQHKPLIFWCLF